MKTSVDSITGISISDEDDKYFLLIEKREKHRERNRKWRKANPDKAHAHDHKWRMNNREHLRVYRGKWRSYNAEYQREWYAKHIEQERKRSIRKRYKRSYNITLEEKQGMLEAQSYSCALCHEPIENISKAHLDHNHKTGQIRSLLCSRCNTYIGFIENTEMLTACLKYLSEHEPPQ